MRGVRGGGRGVGRCEDCTATGGVRELEREVKTRQGRGLSFRW